MKPPDSVELLNTSLTLGRFRAALFDFDGTLSLLREGWAGVMAELGLRYRGISSAEARTEFEAEMLRLSGKPSIFQMRRLAELIRAAGRESPTPEQLLEQFLQNLFEIREERCRTLDRAERSAADWCVAGSHELLESLKQRGVALYLASGTDLHYVRQELAMLGLAEYFEDRVFAPADNTPDFHKSQVVQMMLERHRIAGEQLIGFGDGYSETVEVKRVGGVTVGLATQEAGTLGVNSLKRQMLIELRADMILADYRPVDQLAGWLFGDNAR